MNILIALLTLSLSQFAMASQQSSMRDELPTKKTEGFRSETDKRPQSILIKKDQNGEISVYRSTDLLGKVTSETAPELENLNFEKLSSVEGLDKEKLVAGIEELDRDKPRQSWYYWGWSYAYYYPIYYYAYTYIPYYYYNWGGCSYYWYRWS